MTQPYLAGEKTFLIVEAAGRNKLAASVHQFLSIALSNQYAKEAK